MIYSPLERGGSAEGGDGVCFLEFIICQKIKYIVIQI